jgi:Phosphopantetheinyl transferase
MSDSRVYWILVENVPALEERAGTFLSAREQVIFSQLRFAKRRRDWLLGRWAAKSLVCSLPAYRHFLPRQIEILPTPSGAPQLVLAEKPMPYADLSLSHSHGVAFCAITFCPSFRVGVDIEAIEERSPVFVSDYFTSNEQGLLGTKLADACYVTAIWSMKESMLKALRTGLRLDPRMLEVKSLPVLVERKWQDVQVGEAGRSTHSWVAWWQQRKNFVLTLALLIAEQCDDEITLIESEDNKVE